MILFPAVDLKNGQCASSRATWRARPCSTSIPPRRRVLFAEQGFEYLHVVDLDGAFAGKPMNALAVEAMLKAVTMPVQLGGGIRDLKTVEAWLGKGIARVIIGTAAVRDPELVKSAAKKFLAALRLASMRATARLRSKAGPRLAGPRSKSHSVRGRRRRRHHLHRHRARRPFEGPQSRCDDCAGRSHLDPRHCLRRFCFDRGRQGVAGAARAKKLAGAIAGRALYDGRLDPAAALR